MWSFTDMSYFVCWAHDNHLTDNSDFDHSLGRCSGIQGPLTTIFNSLCEYGYCWGPVQLWYLGFSVSRTKGLQAPGQEINDRSWPVPDVSAQSQWVMKGSMIKSREHISHSLLELAGLLRPRVFFPENSEIGLFFVDEISWFFKVGNLFLNNF